MVGCGGPLPLLQGLKSGEMCIRSSWQVVPPPGLNQFQPLVAGDFRTLSRFSDDDDDDDYGGIIIIIMFIFIIIIVIVIITIAAIAISTTGSYNRPDIITS